MTFFDFLNAINGSKINIIKEDPTLEKDYNSFMINRGLSNFSDTIFFANEMNRYYSLPKKQQFEFYLNAVSKKKRYSKWANKSKNSEDVMLLMNIYNYSSRRALEALDLLNDEQIKELRAKYSYGGK
jgi:hypothetical protein